MNFQRKGAKSNTHVGRSFEAIAQNFFREQGLLLEPCLSVEVGINGTNKAHKFDLGNKSEKVLVECKAHKWTEGDNVPSAKLTVWNEAMFLFYAAPSGYRKILFILRDYSKKRNETLGEYYIRTYSHLIPSDVEVWECDEVECQAQKIK